MLENLISFVSYSIRYNNNGNFPLEQLCHIKYSEVNPLLAKLSSASFKETTICWHFSQDWNDGTL